MTELEMKKLDRKHAALMAFTIAVGGAIGAVVATTIKDNPWKWGSIFATTFGMAYPVVACALSPKFKAAMANECYSGQSTETENEILTVAVQPQEEEKVFIGEPARIPA